ncbi:MAG: hypothetical protein AAFO85_21000, partial [Cyanobacteria bacterium J06598_4]
LNSEMGIVEIPFYKIVLVIVIVTLESCWMRSLNTLRLNSCSTERLLFNLSILFASACFSLL